MGTKVLHDDIFDKGLEQLSNNANWSGGTLTQVLCEGQPADRTEALTLYPTGKRVSTEVSLAGGDLTLADRGGGGREVTVAAKAGTAAADAPGTDLVVALYDGARLLMVTEETTDQAITNANPINFPSYKVGFPDPT